MPDRRTTTRNLCSDIAELTWQDSPYRQQRLKGVLEDISAEGACVQTEDPLPLDTGVRLRLHDAVFEATVRYCTLISGGYFVGVKFEDGRGWIPGSPNPEHLLQIPAAAYEIASLGSEA